MPLSAEQQRAVVRSGQDACCVAGPGSGKTRVLVERFAWLTGKGLDPESILAITFTEKAARELKSRLVRRFENDSALRQKIERAPVSTIHGLCQSLLREYAVEAGIDPEFTVFDDRQSSVELDAAVRTVLDRMATDQPALFRDLISAWASERPASDLAEIYSALRMFGGAARALANQPDLAPLLPDYANRAVDLLRESAGALASPATDAQRRHAALLGELISSRDSRPLLDWLASLSGVNLSGKGKMPGTAELKAARDLAREAIPLTIWIRHSASRGTLTRLLIGLETEYTRRKRLLSGLDFSDLEEQALALLSDHPDIRESLQQRFMAILMDELQDTNPIQWEIVAHLRTPASFFAVGDANQSIYGFRDADPCLFAGYQQAVETSGGEIDRLERNYRSRPEILAEVERFANSGIAPGLTAHRLIPAENPFPQKPIPSIEIQRIDELGEQPESEALWLASRLIELRRTLMVDDPPRPLRWADCAILARTRTPFDLIESAFERFGIPCVIARGRNFFEESEIVDLTNWLRVMDSVSNQPAVFALLRSPFFGLADEEIFLDKRQGAFPPPEPLTRIEALRELRGQLPAELILSRFAAETGYFTRLNPRGQANFEKFLDLLRDLESAHRGDYPYWLEVIDSLASSQEPNAPQTESNDAVQILSIHKSKGLEFPLVAIVGLERGTGNDRGSLNFTRELGLGARWRDTTGLDAENDFAFNVNPRRRNASEDEESGRLLYVAMTRAKSHLLLSWREHGGRSPWPSQIERAWEIQWPDEPDVLIECGEVSVVRRQGIPEITRQDFPSESAPVEWRDPLPDNFHAQPAVSATDLARFDLCPRRYWLAREIGWAVQPNEPGSDPEVASGEDRAPVPRGGAELGSEVHALLAGQILESPSPGALHLADVFRQSELGHRAAQARRVEREYDFLFELDGTLIRGSIDLWFEDGAGVTLVDYKTGHPGTEQLGEYRLQLQIYALALGVLGVDQPPKAFIFLLDEDRSVRWKQAVRPNESSSRLWLSSGRRARAAISPCGQENTARSVPTGKTCVRGWKSRMREPSYALPLSIFLWMAPISRSWTHSGSGSGSIPL